MCRRYPPPGGAARGWLRTQSRTVRSQHPARPSWDSSVNDAFKSVSKYLDRINRPDQLPTALLEAMRTLTSPADTGAVTIALPQDVQAEAWDFPALLFRERTWHVPRARAEGIWRRWQVLGSNQRRRCRRFLQTRTQTPSHQGK